MALNAPAPSPGRRRRAEDREEIPLGIAHHRVAAPGIVSPMRGFERAQDVLEIHDRGRRQIATLAQPGLEQLARQLTLRLGHRFDGQALSRKYVGRNEVPVRPLVALNREGRLLTL